MTTTTTLAAWKCPCGADVSVFHQDPAKVHGFLLCPICARWSEQFFSNGRWIREQTQPSSRELLRERVSTAVAEWEAAGGALPEDQRRALVKLILGFL